MKTRAELAAQSYELIRQAIVDAKPGNLHDVADTLGLLLQCTAEALAAVVGKPASSDACRTVAEYIDGNPVIPTVNFSAPIH